MKQTMWGGVLLALVLTAGLVGLGLVVFNAGVGQGLAQSGVLVAPAAGNAVGVPYAWFGYPHAWGFGFGPLGCLIPLLFILLFFGVLRRLLWFRSWGPGWGHLGRRYWRDHPDWEKGYPPFFETWHRRAHGEPEKDPSDGEASG